MNELLTDEELMQLYKQGDHLAFEALYKRYSGRLYGFLMGKLRGNRPMVDDVFQATFTKLHQARSKYDPAFPFAPWLFTVCRSVLVDQLRKNQRIKEDSNQDVIDRAVALEPAEEKLGLPPLTALSSTQRQAVELRYGDDLSFDEIAKRLETTPTNVRQLISRAVKKLKGGL